jgi:hypothetical protein
MGFKEVGSEGVKCVQNHSASQGIHRLFLWIPKVYYHIYNGRPLDPIMSQENPVHAMSFKSI